MVNIAQVEKRRLKLKLTMDEAATKAGIAGRQKWNDIESGRNANPTLKTLLGMAQALQCSISDLVNEQYPPKKRKR